MRTNLASITNSRTVLRKQRIRKHGMPLLPERVLSLPNGDPAWSAWIAYAEARRVALDSGEAAG